MPQHWTPSFSYVGGAIRTKQIVYLSRVSDELERAKVDHTYVSVWHEGVWRGADIDRKPWTTVGVTVCKHPVEQGLFLGMWGEVLCVGSGDIHDEAIGAGDESPKKLGPMRAVRGIDGRAYAVGMGRQVYRRDDRDRWTPIHEGCRQPLPDRSVVSFEAIDGFSSHEIYAVGRGGEMWRFDGQLWRRIDGPTNAILTSVVVGGDESVYVCGRLGTLIRGRGDSWVRIEHETTEEDFWGLAWFGERLFVSSTRSLYTLEGDRLVRVAFGDDVPSTFFALTAADGALWSIGPKDVMAYDGDAWTRID